MKNIIVKSTIDPKLHSKSNIFSYVHTHTLSLSLARAYTQLFYNVYNVYTIHVCNILSKQFPTHTHKHNAVVSYYSSANERLYPSRRPARTITELIDKKKGVCVCVCVLSEIANARTHAVYTRRRCVHILLLLCTAPVHPHRCRVRFRGRSSLRSDYARSTGPNKRHKCIVCTTYTVHIDECMYIYIYIRYYNETRVPVCMRIYSS